MNKNFKPGQIVKFKFEKIEGEATIISMVSVDTVKSLCKYATNFFTKTMYVCCIKYPTDSSAVGIDGWSLKGDSSLEVVAEEFLD